MPDPRNRLPPSHSLDDGTPATDAPEVMPPRPEPDSPRTQRPEIPTNVTPSEEAPELTIPVDTVAWIILKAREFDVKDPASVDSDDDDGHNALGVLEDRADDPTVVELRNWIHDLDDDEQAELVALMWLGRGDDEDAGTFPGLVEEARRQQQHGRRTVSYLLGTPQLGDYLEEGLEKLGVDTANLEGNLR
jgi:hypothetical protein